MLLHRTPDPSAAGNCSKKTKSLKSINVVKPIPVSHFTARVAVTLDYDGHSAEIASAKNSYKKGGRHHKGEHNHRWGRGLPVPGPGSSNHIVF